MFDRLDLDSALAGDLLEERARGRSALWYWRQVVIASMPGYLESPARSQAARATRNRYRLRHQLRFNVSLREVLATLI